MDPQLSIIKYNLIKLDASGNASIIFDNSSFKVTSTTLNFSGTLPELITKYGIQNVILTYYVQADGVFVDNYYPSATHNLYATTLTSNPNELAHTTQIVTTLGGTRKINTDWIKIDKSDNILTHINFSSVCSIPACQDMVSIDKGWSGVSISVKVTIDILTAAPQIAHFSNLDNAYGNLISPVQNVNETQPVQNITQIPQIVEPPVVQQYPINTYPLKVNQIEYKVEKKKNCWRRYRAAIIWLIILIIIIIIIIAVLSKHHKKCAKWISKNMRK